MKALLILLVPAVALAKKPADLPLGGPSKAVTPEILDAINEEMNRALTELQIEGQPAPYHISYKITEVDVNDVSATLGQTTARKNRHNVFLEARVRVTDGKLDNGNFVVPDAAELDGTASLPLSLDATPRIAKRVAWLVTDQAYKEALIQLRAKEEARKAGSIAGTDAPGWTQEKPVISAEAVLVPELE